MRRFLLSTAAAAALTTLASTAAGSWTNTYTGTKNIHHVVRARDGSLLVSLGGDSSTAFLRVSASDGKVQLAKASPRRWNFSTIAAASDGGAFAIGDAASNSKMAILRLNASLDIQWVVEKPFAAGYEIASNAVATADGGLLVVGKSGNAATAVRVSSAGAILWQRTYKGCCDVDYFDAVLPLRDGTFAITGASLGSPFVARLGTDGAVLWARVFRRGGGLESLAALPNGDFVAAGTTPIDGDLRAWMAAFDEAGAIHWQTAAIGEESSNGGAVTLSGSSLLFANRMGQKVQLLSFTTHGDLVRKSTFDPDGNIDTISADGGNVFVSHSRDGGPGQIQFSLTDMDSSGVPACGAAAAPNVRAKTTTLVPSPLALTSSVAAVASKRIQGSPVPFAPTAVACTRGVAAAVATAKARPKEEAPDPLAAYRKVRRERTALRQHAGELLIRRDFGGLEAMARGFRSSHEEFGSGIEKLQIFYEALSDAGLNAQLSHEDHRRRIDEWLSAEPSSAAAAITKAMFLYGLAWEQRGTADEATPEAEAAFKSTMAEARRAIEEAGKVARRDPHYIVLALIRDSDDGGEHTLQLLGESAALRPYAPAFKVAAQRLTPGSPEYVAVMNAAGRDLKSRYGDGIYAEIAWAAALRSSLKVSPHEGLDDIGAEWQRVRNGYRELIAQYPDWAPLYHRLAYMASLADDRDTAREMFARPELAWSGDAGDWWPDAEDYRIAKSWAGAAIQRPGRSRAILRSTVTSVNGAAQSSLNTFFVKTPKAVYALTAIPQMADAAPQQRRVIQGNITNWSVADEGRTLQVRACPPAQPGFQGGIAAGVVADAAKLSGVTVFAFGGSREPGIHATVIACTNGAASCSEKRFEGTIGESVRGRFLFTPRSPVDFRSLVGSPLVDDRGVVFGYVLGADGPQANCEDIEFQLEALR